MRDIFKAVVGIIAILIGVTAIIRLIGNVEIIMGVIALTFGVMALIWTFKARKSLSQGSSLRRYTGTFFTCLVFIVAFSVWRTLERMFLWREKMGEFMAYPEYFFITLAYVVFVLAAYQIMRIGKEFGFETQAQEIKKIIKKKKR